MFYLEDKTEDLSPGGSLSGSSGGLLLRGLGGAWMYRSFGNKDQNVQRLLLTKENHTSQVNGFSTFYAWEDARFWTH